MAKTTWGDVAKAMRDGSFKPWACAECGQKNISANKQVCPKCHIARPGSDAANAEAAEVASGQTTRTYEGEKARDAGIVEMSKQGWKVTSVNAYQPRAGAGRIVALGLLAAVAKPPMRFTVIFERATA
jgi:sRNA-binding protein